MTRDGWPLLALAALLALVAAFSFGRVSADDRPIVYHRDVVQGPEWQIYVVPPCEENPLNEVAIGLTWDAALRNARALTDRWPRTRLIVGHDYKHVNKDGTVCP